MLDETQKQILQVHNPMVLYLLEKTEEHPILFREYYRVVLIHLLKEKPISLKELKKEWFPSFNVDERNIRRSLYILKEEGYIKSEKKGRETIYSLTPKSKKLINEMYRLSETMFMKYKNKDYIKFRKKINSSLK